MTEILIRKATILQVDDSATTPQVRLLREHDLLIQGQRITAIQPSQAEQSLAADQVIDAAGMLAIPGLINTHCHAAMVLFRGMAEDLTVDTWFNDIIWPMEANLTPEDVYWGTQLALAEMIEAGVTTVADHYFYMDGVAQAIEQAGTRGLLAWAVFSAGVPDPAQPLQRTIEFIKRWQGAAQGRITTWLGPHAPYTCDVDFLRTVVHAAQDLAVGIHIHVAETAEQTAASIRHMGQTPVGILQQAGIFEVPTLLAHAVHVNDDDIRLMAEAGAGVAHCPKTFLKMAAGIAPIRHMRAAGIPVGLGTDGAASNNTLDILEQLRLAAMLQKHEAGDPVVMPLHEALHMAFQGGAQALRMPDLGALAVGKLADVVLLRTDAARMHPLLNVPANLLYNAQSADVDTVICNGQVLLQQGKLLTLDKARILQEVYQRLERLHQRVPNHRIQSYKL